MLVFIVATGLMAIETGAAWLLIPGLVVLIALGRWLDPYRPYWGPGPAEIMGDPDERRRYMRSEIPYLVAIAVLAFLGLFVLRAYQAAS
mgnify:CR=1 FL=1